MAAEMKLNFIIDAQDKTKVALNSVNNNMTKLQGKVKAMGPTFKKMAMIGTAAFAAISYGIGTTLKSAMAAEGAYNKFNTVFGEHKDDMLEFVEGLRKEMPTATHEIIMLAAGLGDLLIPMGIARSEATEMTQGFLTLSNKIAAFNDVSPKEVIEAIGSALVGSSEPMRRFGVDTRVTTLEATALTAGLIKEGETFAKLTPEIRAQVTAQAVLIQITNQSADAIEGFSENQDSALRRTQDLQASITDASVEIGNALLPLYDSILKKLLPIVENMAIWIKENPKLTKIIIIGVAALTGLVAVLGLIGLILPVIITLVALLTAVSAPWLLIITAIIVVIGLFIAIGWMLYKDWNYIMEGFKIIFREFKENVINAFTKVKDFFVNVWNEIKNIIGGAIDWLMEKIQPFIAAFEKVKAGAAWIGEKAGGAVSWLKGEGQLGIPYVPETGAYLLHRGESVVTAGATAGGVGGITINVMGGNYLSEDAAEMFGEELANELKRNIKL